ncbi:MULTISPECIES: glycoside hydrolase family 43 protein [Paenibacillus]|uniref:glycoside hydrolase family 43 protein n=1 Tax=Paenibacillus TaxID=44249 RepID=UPI00300AAA85
MQYMNPVIPGFHPDPSICRVGEDYYLVSSSFHYFPGVPIFHSRDLIHWQQIGHCLDRKEQINLARIPSSYGIFAPTLRHIKGYFYMITTNVRRIEGGNFYVRALKPSGPWSEPVWLDWPGIDPSLFCDEDGKVYITGTNDFEGEEAGIYQAEIDLESGRLLSTRRLIWKGTGGKSPEGPHLYVIQGEYYLMISEGGTEYGHMVTIARSSQPYGPFEADPENPILSHRSLSCSVQATGHADLVQAHDGSWWAVCLGIRTVSRKHHLGRETFLAPVQWSEEGWPVIGTKGSIDLQMAAPAFMSAESAIPVTREHFSEQKLSDNWNFIRNPYSADWSLTERPGWLTLRGSRLTLDDPDSPAFVGRRQQHMECTVSSLIEFDPALEGDEAGLTVIMDERFHYEIALAFKNGRKVVLLRRRLGTLSNIEAEVEYTSQSIILEVEADPKLYTFAFYVPNGERIILGQGECGLLSSEVAGGFTGVYFGLYATGNGKNAGSPAYIDWFDYNAR